MIAAKGMSDRDNGSVPSPTGLPPKLGGKYRPIRHIASGGMGAVYEVEHEMTGERLALKVIRSGADPLDATTLERFRREARVHALLKNEHIVRVIDADVAQELGGTPFLVMDLLDGENLADLVGNEPQPSSRVVGWLHEIAAPLDAAHAAGIIHRDLKPENLFLARRQDGTALVKILDFGIAKGRDGDQGHRTSTGAVVGTPLYMAPEQAAAEHEKIGRGTDVWSVGMIAFRLLTGRPYWSAGNVSMLLAELVSGPVRAPSSKVPRLTPAFDAWFMRSCARDPSLRFGSVSEQVAALADALSVELPEPNPISGAPLGPTSPDLSRAERARATPVQSIGGSVASPAAPERGGSRLLLVALGLLVVAAAAGLIYRNGTEGPYQQAASAPTVLPLLAVAPSPALAPSATAAALTTATGSPTPKPEPAAKASPRKPPTRPVGPAPAAGAPSPPASASAAPASDPLADPK